MLNLLRLQRLALAGLAWTSLGAAPDLPVTTSVAEPLGLTVDVQPAEPVQGQLIVIELSGPATAQPITGTLGTQSLRFFLDDRNRVRALAAVPVGTPPGPLELKLQVEPDQGQAFTRGLSILVRKANFPSEALTIDPKYVKAPASQRARIARENSLLRRLALEPASERQWRGSFRWPVPPPPTSVFGILRTLNGQAQGRHLGVDLDGAPGDPIQAIGVGTVVLAQDLYYSGGTILIDHGGKLTSMYFHMSALEVKTGERVTRGQVIGRVGSTGRSTGPHLHLGTKLGGTYFDPESLITLDLAEGPEPVSHP